MTIARILPLSLLPFLVPSAPAPGLFRSKKKVRRLDCERLSTEAATTRYPGQIEPERPRGDYVERDVVRCQPRLLREGLRTAHTEALLHGLERSAQEIAGRVGALGANGTDRTWLIEAHDPDVRMVGKLRFALQNAMVGQGLSVTDRTPRLGLADLDVITRMPPAQAYPAACRRYAENGSLGPDQALVALMSLDPRETALHAGVCVDGGWTWLR